MIEIIIVSAIFFSAGFVTGAYLKAESWYSEDWIILKWCKKSLGYRPMASGSKIQMGDDVIMSLQLNTSAIPSEGLEVVVETETSTL
jgi:hypothetical protein